MIRGMLIAAALTWAGVAAARPPNFVVILIDDLGYADIGPFGATKQKTPRLDRMAREGMRFTSFYAAPVCSVSRAQLLTGCYGARVSVPGVFGPASRHGLHPAELTIADHLRHLGYATACIGKWHLGDQPDFLPTRQGFDRYVGIPYSNDMQKNDAKGRRVVPLLRDEAVERLLEDDEQAGIVGLYTDEAVRFIRENRSRPFFLYLPHTAVHTPIHPGPAFAGRSANGRFGDWVEELDDSTGRVLDTLRDLGLDESTLVIFTSDNGPWLVKGPDGGCALPLRGGKGSTWEGGVRVPTLARWPGRIPAGATCDAVAGAIDLLPTLVALAGGTVPAEPAIDGRDISPLLFGASRESPREAHYYFAGYNLQAVRQGPWKLAITPQPATPGASPVEAATTAPRLYNLDRDIGERTDLAAEHPDLVARLRALAAAMAAEIGGSNPRSRRPPGECAASRLLYETAGGDERRRRGRSAAATVAPAAADLLALRPGDAIGGESAPNIGGRPFRVSFDLSASQRDAVLIAHGGASAGYVVYLRDGRVVFAVRTGAGAPTEIASEAALNGPARVEATLDRDGGMRLDIDGRTVATGRAPSLIVQQPAEDFCVGHDNGRPLAAYPPAARRFEGTIARLAVTPLPDAAAPRGAERARTR